MGESKPTYYYIKRKPRSLGKKIFLKSRPEVVLQSAHALGEHANVGAKVLNLEFNLEKPRFWVGILRWTLFIVLTLVVYLTGVFLYTGSDALKEDLLRKGQAATLNLQQGAEAFEKMDMDKAFVSFQLAKRNFDGVLELFAELGQSHILLANLTLPNSQIWQSQALFLSGQHLANAGMQLTDAIKPLISYWGGLAAVGGSLQNAGENIGQILINNSRKIDIALAEVELADQELQSIKLQSVDASYASLVMEAKTKTEALREAMQLLGNLTKRLPKALGFGIPQTYLILNQNNNELRPTGGFIGSVVWVEVYHGKMKQVLPDTAQRLDGQNQYSDLDLPTPLKEVTAYYGLRDANWEPNFPTSVQTIETLYQQAGGGSVDGVISLTPSVVTDILRVVGPIDLPQYGFQLTADNFVAKTQQQIEIVDQNKYNPKQVLIDFVPVLMNRLTNASSREMRDIGDKLFKRLLSKDVLIYFDDAQLEEVVTNLGWSGEIKSIGNQEDYLYVVDANLGGNKSSGAIVKEMALKTKIKSNATIQNSLSLKYTHTGSFKFPDGINKNYVRVYVPMGSHITQTTGQDEGTPIDVDSSDGKTVVGFWLTTNPGETKEVNLEYELPFSVKFINAQFIYKILIQKQSGSDRTVFSNYIEVADNFDLAVKTGGEAVRKDMLFSDKLTNDEIITSTVRKYR